MDTPNPIPALMSGEPVLFAFVTAPDGSTKLVCKQDASLLQLALLALDAHKIFHAQWAQRVEHLALDKNKPAAVLGMNGEKLA